MVFLDIPLDDMDGIAPAIELRKRRPDCILIFISNHVEFAPDGYKVSALRYLIKTHIEKNFDELMGSIFEQLGTSRTIIRFRFIDKVTETYIHDISYLESRLHYIFVYFKNGGEIGRFRGKLDSMQNQLPENEFVRIHKSYLVNLRHLSDARNYTAKLSDGTVLPISQSFFSEVKEVLYLYRGRASVNS